MIDPSTNILYLVACTLENNTMVYRLHAVNITNGTEPYPNVVISGSYNGVTFDAPHQTQRVSLALSGNQVVFAFAAMEEEGSDVGGYAGWVMAYNKATLAQSGAFATVSTGTLGGGVWQSGRPPVVDSSGYVYVFVGNGYVAGYDGVHDFSESVLKLNPANGLKLVDWFTPSNWSALDSVDADLSSSGPMLIPWHEPDRRRRQGGRAVRSQYGQSRQGERRRQRGGPGGDDHSGRDPGRSRVLAAIECERRPLAL